MIAKSLLTLGKAKCGRKFNSNIFQSFFLPISEEIDKKSSNEGPIDVAQLMNTVELCSVPSS